MPALALHAFIASRAPVAPHRGSGSAASGQQARREGSWVVGYLVRTCAAQAESSH